MGKRKTQTNHLYLGVGGMLAVSALVVALTFGLSSAQDNPPPPPVDQQQPPPGGNYMPPPPPPTGGALCPAGSRYPNVAPPPDRDCYGNPVGGGMNPPPCGGTGQPQCGSMGPCGGANQPPCGEMNPPPCGGTGQPPCGGQMSSADMSACTARGKVWCPSNSGGSGWCKEEPGPCPTTNNNQMRQCALNEQPTAANPCIKGCEPPREECPTGQSWDPGRCMCQSGTPMQTMEDTRTTGSCKDPMSGRNLLGPGQMITAQACRDKGGMPDFGYGQPQTSMPQYPQWPDMKRGTYDMSQPNMPMQCAPGNRQRPDGGCEPICNRGSHLSPDGQRCEPDMRYGIFGPSMMMPPMPGPGGESGRMSGQDEERMKQEQAKQEEQFKKMQEEQEKQFKRMQEDQIKKIKKELGRMQTGIKSVRKKLDKIEVKENMPEEIVTAKEALVEIDDAMKQAETCSGEDCFDIMPQIGPLMGDIMNPGVMEAIEMLKQGPKFVKKLEAEIKRVMTKAFSGATVLSQKAVRIKDADMRKEVLDEITEAQGACKTLGAEIMDSFASGQLEDVKLAQDRVQEELVSTCGGIAELNWKIDGFLNKQKVVRGIDKLGKSFSRQLAKFQKDIQRGRFDGDLDAVSQFALVIPDIEAKLAEIKKEKDIDALGDLFDEAASLISSANDFIEDAQTQNIANQFDMFRTSGGGSVSESNPSPAP